MRGQRFSEEFKTETLVKLKEANDDVHLLAKELHLSPNTLYKWRADERKRQERRQKTEAARAARLSGLHSLKNLDPSLNGSEIFLLRAENKKLKTILRSFLE